MRKALVTAVGLAGLAATAVPVLAAPTADEGRTAEIQVATTLPSGDTLRLDISAAQLSTGPVLVIDSERCDADGGCVTKTYAGELPAGALTISSSEARAKLDTTLDGRSLAVSWSPQAQPGVSGSTGQLEGDGPDDFFTIYAGSSADVTVRYDASGCRGVGGVGEGVVVDTSSLSGVEIARPLTALHLPDGTAFRC